jgi:hypothetical protein
VTTLRNLGFEGYTIPGYRPARDPAPLSSPLLEAPAERGLESSRPQSDPGDRRGGRGPESQNGRTAARTCGNHGSTSPRSSEEFQEVPRSTLPRRERQGPPRALGRLSPLRRPFRQASEKFRAGDRDAVFPLGSFPPALPFVGGLTFFRLHEPTDVGVSVGFENRCAYSRPVCPSKCHNIATAGPLGLERQRGARQRTRADILPKRLQEVRRTLP